MKLIIVESPSKAKTIEKYLGGEYTVRASVGHVRDLPVSEYVYFDEKNNIIKGDSLKRMKKADKQKLTKKLSIDIENDFKPFYIVDEKKKNVIKELKDLAKKSNTVLLATDPDREGEAIAWHLADELGLLDNAKRIRYQEITKNAIEEAIANPTSIDMNLKEAQEARRVLDRLVGYELSDIIWKKVRYGLSAGRVQSPALRILVEREKEIMEFVPEKYFELTGEFKTTGKTEESKTYTLTFDCEEIPKDIVRTKEIVSLGENSNWTIKDIKETDTNRNPNAPFTTSSLQQTASTRLGFSPKRTMQIAQKLYEKGLITYMRTDSTNLSKSFLTEANTYLNKNYGKEYAKWTEYKTKNKNAQEAHEAIRPTHAGTKSAGTNEDEKKLYNLIWVRSLSSQMQPAKIKRTKITLNSDNNKVPDFHINGSIITFYGWLQLDILSKGEEVELPKLQAGSDIKNEKINYIEKETLPPNRYTEAGLIKELEKRGIGRPSTYASIISTLEERKYADKQQRTLFPTSTGIVVSDFLSQHFAKYISDDFTKNMEDELDEIANGTDTYLNTLTQFYTPFHSDVESKKDIDKATNVNPAPENIRCPKCASAMVEKLSRNGTFYSCVNFPECDGARKIDGSIMEGPKLLDKKCPSCSEKGKDNNLVERDGKYGKFIACSSYPKCKYIEKSEEEKQRANTGIKCNHCNDGYMEERRGRFGVFYSCSNYPDCKHAIKAKPTGEFCKLCGEMMMEGTKTIPTRCSNKNCKMHNPHKI
ncbi:MAG: topoisomerase [Patescibacteria group bacterium]|nr:topoisomerase [Patescibacteria group bacterium]